MAEGQKNIGMAVLCYLGILILVPLLTDAKNDAFVKFHLKQGIVLIIASIAISVINIIPIIGQLISIVGGLIVFVLWIMGIINAAGGQEKELPIIGKYGSNFNL
ncbi:MAG: hypothetical protein ABIJ72_04305 [bacterium]